MGHLHRKLWPHLVSMAFEQIRFDRTLSKFELALAAISIGILITVFINKMLFMTAVAEARSLELTINNMRTGIMSYVATQLIDGNYENIAKAAANNPVGDIITPHKGYRGEFDIVSNENVKPGEWAYETSSGSLIYYVLNRDYLNLENGGADRISLKLELNYDDNNANHSYNPGIDRPRGLSLVINEQVEWLL